MGSKEAVNNEIEDLSKIIELREETDPDVKSKICKKILEELPDHFGIPQAVDDYVQKVKDQFFVLAKLSNKPVGFIAIRDHNEFTSEVYVMGILKEFQGRCIGKRLIEKVEQHLKNKKYLTVKTLSPSNLDKGYEKTRAFYRGVGFLPLEEFTTLWDENNPCLFMIKSLN